MATIEELILAKKDGGGRKVVELAKRLDESLYMNRVPLKTKESFKTLAHDLFNGDYGMALMHLVDSYEMNGKYVELERRIKTLEERK